MNRQHQRYYIQTRTILGFNPTAIHKELTTAHGNDVISYSTVLRWSTKTDDGIMEIEDEPRSGRPVTASTEENIQLVQDIIDEDPHSSYADIIEETGLSKGTIETIIHDHLKLRKISSRWVPHDLTAEQKRQRVQICQENLKKFQEGSTRIYDIVTGDETWIYLRQVRRKQSNATWVKKGEKPGTVTKRDKFEPKVLFSIFFRSTGPLLVHAVDKGKTIDRNYYIARCLKPVVRKLKKQRPNTGLKCLKLLHDNAPAHENKDVFAYLKDEGFNLLPHPPYSPDLSPCDFWLNDYIKCNLPDQKDEESLVRAVRKIVREISQEDYRKTFRKLIERMELCINNNGEYFEHLMK